MVFFLGQGFLEVSGHTDGRPGHDRQSADVLARSPRPLLRAVGADTYGRALLAAGDRTAGLQELDRAWDYYHLMGAWAWSAEIQRIMRQAGTRRAKWSVGQPRPATGWAAVSDAERRVAALIGSGVSPIHPDPADPIRRAVHLRIPAAEPAPVNC